MKALQVECKSRNVTFCFIETGTVFIKDGRRCVLPKKHIQSEMAFKSGASFSGKPIEWRLADIFGNEIPKDKLYVAKYGENCAMCGSKPICNGCSSCGKCGGLKTT